MPRLEDQDEFEAQQDAAMAGVARKLTVALIVMWSAAIAWWWFMS